MVFCDELFLLIFFRPKPGCDLSLPLVDPDLAQEAGDVQSLQLVLKQRPSLAHHQPESHHPAVVGQRHPHPKHLHRRLPPRPLQDSLPVLLPLNWKRRKKGYFKMIVYFSKCFSEKFNRIGKCKGKPTRLYLKYQTSHYFVEVRI